MCALLGVPCDDGAAGGGGVAHGRFLARLALVTQETPQLFGFLTSTHFAARHLLPALAERVRDGYAGLARALADEDAAGTGELERRALLRLLYAAGVELSDAEVRRGRSEAAAAFSSPKRCFRAAVTRSSSLRGLFAALLESKTPLEI